MRCVQVMIAVVGLVLVASAAQADTIDYTINTTGWGSINVVDADFVNTTEADGGTAWHGALDGAYVTNQYEIRPSWGGKPSQALYAICAEAPTNGNAEELVTTVAVPNGTYNVFVLYAGRGDQGAGFAGTWARLNGTSPSTFCDATNGVLYEDTPDCFDGYVTLVGQQTGTQLSLRTWLFDQNGANAPWSRSVYYGIGYTAVATPEPGTLVLVMTGLFGLLAYAWRKRK